MATTTVSITRAAARRHPSASHQTTPPGRHNDPMTTPASMPTTPAAAEAGWPGNMTGAWDLRNGPGFAPKEPDGNAELRFPESVRIYEQMRNTDSQTKITLAACAQPIRYAAWTLEGDIRPEVEDLVRTQLGLARPGETLPARHGRIIWRDHLADALLSLSYGFMPFEQIYQITTPGDPGHPTAGPLAARPIAHLHKLAPRMPTTLTSIRIDADGGLQGIVQAPPPATMPRPGQTSWPTELYIQADRLVVYTHDKEGANWYGRSILRTAYKDWLIKDKLVRINAQSAERNGMGLPVVEYDPESGMTKTEALELATEVRAGAQAGVAIPAGQATLKLLGVTGSTMDPLPSIKYHDQAISRSAMAMFLDLGHDAGARSLGDTFVRIFTRSLQTTADRIAETATEHIIGDLVRANFGPDEPYPKLSPGQLTDDDEVTAEVLGTLVDAGIITPDGTLEKHVRDRWQLPPAAEDQLPGDADRTGQLPVEASSGAINPATTYARQLAQRIEQLSK